MGWFDEQIKIRMADDQKAYEVAYQNLAEALLGQKNLGGKNQAQSALEEILDYYGVEVEEENLAGARDQEDLLERALRPVGIMRRRVTLDASWYKDALGAMLGCTKTGEVVALIPAGLTGYSYYHPEKKRRVRITRRTAADISPQAYCFYKPLPMRSLGVRDLVQYLLSILSVPDYALIVLVTLLATLLGMFIPYTTQLAFARLVPSQDTGLLLPLATLLGGVAVSGALLGITKGLVMTRVEIKLSIAVEAAAMVRVTSLPVSFFQAYSAGELRSRVESISSLCRMLSNTVLTLGLSSLFSLAYVGQILYYAPALALPALAVIGLTLGLSLATTLLHLRVSRQTMQLKAKLGGLVYALLAGIQKIKLTGAEQRAFAKWAEVYGKIVGLSYHPPLLLKLHHALGMLIASGGLVLGYHMAVTHAVTPADYMAFSAAYGMMSAGVLALGQVVTNLADSKPLVEMAEPLLQTQPETAQGRRVVTQLRGQVELSHISFRYGETGPWLLDNLRVKIEPGEYVALVGRTGCGKSTLVRLLLGFETPQRGAVYYDNADLQTLEPRSLRQHIGIVLQDGKLFSGDIFSNIAIASPGLTMAEAWEAAELAGIAEDIRAMPMGMHTVISHGTGGISGGQRQRLLIARAVASKPRILIFDEATSALDNITQKKIADALEGLRCTRIVIAHRLSTIRQCQRILVLENGKIKEQGQYEQLVAKQGLFAELVARQQL